MIYQNYVKRALDFFLSLCALVILSPMFLVLIIVGAIMMKGNPFFTQQRPGKNENIFKLIKFRTMSNAKDKEGNLLPDDQRLNQYGKFLRSTSLDELPELINILKGDMSIIGPRPQLVKDMVFMTSEERRRHQIRPGLSGLAQVNGRNAIRWEDKLNWDLKYLEHITFLGDVKIIFLTISKVFKREDINRNGTESDLDYGDYLLIKKKITDSIYKEKLMSANAMLEKESL